MMQRFIQAMRDDTQNKINGIHTACPAVVTKVNVEDGTVNVKPVMYKKTKNYELLPYPEIFNVPILHPQGNGQYLSITLPISEGDSCLLIFAENSLDYWREAQVTNTDLKFDLTNAICIPGLYSVANSDLQEACEENKLIIKAGLNKISLSIDGGIELTGEVTINGNLNVNGSVNANAIHSENYIHANGEVIGDGVDLKTHTHKFYKDEQTKEAEQYDGYEEDDSSGRRSYFSFMG